MCTQKERMLLCVLFDLKPEWEQDLNALKEAVRKEGVSCARLTEAIWKVPEEMRKRMVVLTDSAETGGRLAREGIVYFGCLRKNCTLWNQEKICSRQPVQKERKPDGDTVWFDGAALVLEGFEEVDVKYLEEWMLRAQGLPAEIVRTDRLVIREMTKEDLPDLVRIGRQSEGTGPGLRPDAFTEEWMQAYISSAYRLQGFGLWSVLYEGRVIGCCGFEPCGSQDIYTHRMNLADEVQSYKRRTDDGRIDEDQADEDQTAGNGQLCRGQMDNGQTDESRTDGKPLPERQENEYGQGLAASKQILEMQYMLDSAYHRQGFGTEMCRAALDYARERLDADEVRLKIREENRASQALAKKLGFWQPPEQH